VGNPGLFFQKPSREATATHKVSAPSGHSCHWRIKKIFAEGSNRAAVNSKLPLILRRSGSRSPLMVTLHYFAFGGKPILGFAACARLTLLVEFIGAAPNFLFNVDGNNVLTRLWLSNFKLPGFWRDFAFWLYVTGNWNRRDCIYIGITGWNVGVWFFTRTIGLAT
jgi:hypothetical protein